MADETYYEILAVSKTASAGEIRAAYLRLIREVHPDRLANAPDYWKREADARSKDANEAYSVLSDSKKRRVYDAQVNAYRTSPGTDSRTSAAQSTSSHPTSSPQSQSHSSTTPGSNSGANHHAAQQQPAASTSTPYSVWASQSSAQKAGPPIKPSKFVLGCFFCIVLGLAIGLWVSQSDANNKPPLARGDVKSEVKSKPTSSAEKPVASAVSSGESEHPFTPEQLKTYYTFYSAPDVQYLRTLFDGYLAGASGHEREFNLLKQWSPDYYRSKFIVISRYRAVMGGTEIDVIFQQKPDKVFYAWVYPVAGQSLELRSFQPSNAFAKADMSQVGVAYKSLLEDKDHAM
jgi:curved DNA-binding protein CbpA